MASSFVYIINDCFDAEEDKKHPKKKNRPVASGQVKISQALLFSVFVFLLTSVFSLLSGWVVLVTVFAYLSINLLYSKWLKRVIILDVLIISLGFLLRVFAGGIAIGVSVSIWLLLCTGLLSLYLGFCKRRAELWQFEENEGEGGKPARSTLTHYSVDYLERLLTVNMSLTIITYILYVINGSKHYLMPVTIPFVIFGIFRYEFCVIKSRSGESPEDFITGDPPFVINAVAYVFVSFLAVFFS